MAKTGSPTWIAETRARGAGTAPPTARGALGEAAGWLGGAEDVLRGLRGGMAESYGARGGRMGAQAQQAALGMGLTPLEAIGAGQEALLDVNRQYYSQLPQMEMGFLQSLAPLWQSYAQAAAGIPLTEAQTGLAEQQMLTPMETMLRNRQAQEAYYDLVFPQRAQMRGPAGAPGASIGAPAPTGQRGTAAGQGAAALPGFQEMGGDTQAYMNMLQTIGQNPDMIRGLAALTGRSLQTTPQPSTQGRGIQPAQYQPAPYQSPLGGGGQPTMGQIGAAAGQQISDEELWALASAVI